jgi:hypothetical protein
MSKFSSLKQTVFDFLLKSKNHHTFAFLAEKFHVNEQKIVQILASLEKDKKNFFYYDHGVLIKNHIEKDEPTHIHVNHLVGKRIRFGFVTDNHLGSKYERLDVLNALYDRFALAGLKVIYNAGNVIDGEARFNKFDLHVHGMKAQCDYFAKMYPVREGIKTFFITGDDHEGWYVQREGVNIGKMLEQASKDFKRNDLKYLGHMEHDVFFNSQKGKTILRIVHPGGGSSYAFSYQPQKIVESYSPGEKPHILLLGHYHKASYDYIRGVHVLQGGTTMDQSPFMRKKRLEAHIGGWICEFQQGEDGIVQSFQSEWIPFYGKNFYDKDNLWYYRH